MTDNALRTTLLLLTLVPAILAAQFSPNKEGGIGGPYFEARIFPTFSEDTGDHLARVYVQFANDYLTFVKSDTGFEAEVQIDIYLTDDEQNFLFNRTLTRHVTVRDYQLTNAPNIINTVYSDIDITPGNYRAKVAMLDRNSNRQINTQSDFVATTMRLDARNRFLISDVLFLQSVSYDSLGNIVSFSPVLSNQFSGDVDHFYAYFNTFVFHPEDSIYIEYRVRDSFGSVVLRHQYLSEQQSPYMEHFVRLNRYNFERSTYRFEVAATNGLQRMVADEPFAFFWHDLPNTVEDLDQALRQLDYIAEKDSIKHYLGEATFQEKQQFFRRFWAARDPNPGTSENELQVEYYRRVKIADENFAVTGQKGWTTDRGRILIKFGEPDDYERHPFEAESYPYEIWRYYEQRKTFLFIDRTGFGDYILHPNYYFVEYD